MENNYSIFTTGFNQLYSLDRAKPDYLIKFNEFKNIITKNFDTNENIKKKYKESINLIYTKIKEYLKENVLILNQKEFIKNNNIIVYNSSIYNLLIDEICISKYANLKINYVLIDELEDSIKEELKLKRYVYFYSDNADILVNLKKKFKENFFTILLNTFIYSYESNEINNIKNYLLSNSDNVYKDSDIIVNENINFIANNIYSLNYYHLDLIKNNINTYQKLTDYFNKLNPKIILLYIFGLEIILYQDNFTCDNLCFYKPFANITKKDIIGKADIVYAIPDCFKSYIKYKEYFDYLSRNYKLINDIQAIANDIDKNKQNTLLNEICNKINEDIENNNINFNIKKYKLSVLNSIDCNINIFNDSKKFLEKLNENKINFPIIVKYTSSENYILHFMTIILSEKYLENYINYIKNEFNNSRVKCLIQSLINHSGYIIKANCLGNYMYFQPRPSVIDIDINNNELLYDLFQNKGYWSFSTFEINGEKYKKEILEKYANQKHIINFINNDKNFENFIYYILQKIRHYSKLNLFNIDLLIDFKRKEIIIIDINSGSSFRNYDKAPLRIKELVQDILNN